MTIWLPINPEGLDGIYILTLALKIQFSEKDAIIPVRIFIVAFKARIHISIVYERLFVYMQISCNHFDSAAFGIYLKSFLVKNWHFEAKS